MPQLDATRVRRRFLILRTLRYLPTGLLVPVLILLLLDRGLSLAQVGLVTAAQGLMILLLELPTGGLSDVLGRRPVQLGAIVLSIGSIALFTVADSIGLLVLVCALQGVYRALDSGPLDAWYVDTAQAADPDADIERGLAQGGVVIGVGLGAGALLSSGLVAIGPLGPIDALVLPLLASIALELVHLTAVATLMTEVRPHTGMAALKRSVTGTGATVAHALRLVGGDRTLLALVSVELLWGFGMTAFEAYTPVKLELVLADAEAAAALYGPVSAVAWIISAGGAACVPLLTRRMRAAHAAAAMRIAQGTAVVGIGLAAGPVGVVVAFLATMLVHGAANPVHQGLLHRAVDGPSHRATLVSANSMTAQSGGAVGGIALGALADATNLNLAIFTGAAVLAAAAPLYLIARTPAPMPCRIAPAARTP